MSNRKQYVPQHPLLSRRAMIQAGAVGLLGLGTNHLDAFRAVAADSDRA